MCCTRHHRDTWLIIDVILLKTTPQFHKTSMSVGHLYMVAGSDTIRSRTRTMRALDPRHVSRPSCFDGHKKEVTTSGGSRSSRSSQQLTHTSETLLTKWRKTTSYTVADDPADDEGQGPYLMLYSVIVGCIKNRPLRLIMEM